LNSQKYGAHETTHDDRYSDAEDAEARDSPNSPGCSTSRGEFAGHLNVVQRGYQAYEYDSAEVDDYQFLKSCVK
jgi:hypothetical protein